MEEFGIGCTIIKGDLEIKIFDDIFNLTDELQKYLGNVETILGNIKIHRFVHLAFNEKSFFHSIYYTQVAVNYRTDLSQSP